jgi:hypothetical protein
MKLTTIAAKLRMTAAEVEALVALGELSRAFVSRAAALLVIPSYRTVLIEGCGINFPANIASRFVFLYGQFD